MENNKPTFKYNVGYTFNDGAIANTVGCCTYSQAEEISEAILLFASKNADDVDGIVIEDAETGEVVEYPVSAKEN
ncbi:hypothetical protein [Bacillus sp. 03113]|uniref:hypothetical protein n=1 Tax=Bacillus sp. 03113 TaxID=2578211 RepID=UPI001144BFB7|nr:hypothetical protein [Bacillus sp. 03113]